MSFIQQRKGIVLVLVGVLVLLFALAEVAFFSILKYRLKKLETQVDSTKAFYLMESACSVALRDIRDGKIGTTPGKWIERDVDIPLGEKTYAVHYKVEKDGALWSISGSMNSPLNLDRTYHLSFGGLRAFPIFIRGKP